MDCKYDDLHSRASITPDSDITDNLLQLHHSFGYDSGRRSNLQLLDERTLVFIAGNLLVFMDIHTKEQRYLRSCSGQGIGSIAVHTSRKYFAVGEKGNKPNIIVYKHPSLKPFHILRGGAERMYSCLSFNHDGSLLASVSSFPDFMLTLWNWREAEVMLSCKAMSPEVYRISFSPHNPGLLTSAGSGHIKFWKMASTFTGLKLQGLMGHFGKSATTDIEGYVELPDGKVVSGSDRGNMLLWEGNSIKVEICRKDGRTCHMGTVQPFALEDGQLMTFGSDGAIRGWDLESIDSADIDSGRFELEPMNEMVVGHNVSLSWMVKSPLHDSFVWFAQDSRGAIWKLDLSFTYTTPDPECLLSFHAGAIEALHVSSSSHLMATTTLARSVKVFDFLAKSELAQISFNQGGTALSWAPLVGNQTGALLMSGFEDGVIRLLELFRNEFVSDGQEAKLRLRQAFKPHNAPVTAVAYERHGAILATGSSDCTVFFFTVGETYDPIGFIHVPGPVQWLQWSPLSHTENRLLILCQNGFVVEVHCPKLQLQNQTKTFCLADLPRRSFRFKSIKSQVKREEESRQMTEGEKCCREEEFLNLRGVAGLLYCGFYSQPGHFWLSMGGEDAGSLYHCKFSERQEEEPEQWDEPFDYRRLHNNDPIHSITFSSTRQLMFCGLHSGSIRVYKLQPDDPCLTSMHACWELSVHDNQYGHLKHICCSYDDRFVLMGGDDGNIFSFSLTPTEELQKGLRRVKLPGHRVGHEKEDLAEDIDDPAAYSIEAAMQTLEKDHIDQEAAAKLAEKSKKLSELQKAYQHLLKENQSLPEHIRLTPTELMLDHRFTEKTEREKAEKVREVQKQLAWEEERSSRGLCKLQEWFKESLNSNIVTVAAITSDHRVTTYSLQEPTDPSGPQEQQGRPEQRGIDGAAAAYSKPSEDGLSREASQLDAVVPVQAPALPPSMMKLADRQMERLRKAAEKAEQARAKIEKRRHDWELLYAEKPKENREDPQDVQAICEAKEKIGDFKLKSAKDFTLPKHLRMTLERKRAEKMSLEEKLREKQTEMNRQILALRDSKARLVSELHEKSNQLQRVHKLLPSHLHHLSPSIPKLLPEERGGTLKEHRNTFPALERTDGLLSLLEQMEEEMEELGMIRTDQEEQSADVELSQLEEELLKETEIKLLYLQDSILQQMKKSICQFDAQLVLHHQKLLLDWKLKLADVHQLTLYQELLVLQEVNQREELLQERLLTRLQEENGVTSKLEERNKQLELRRREVAKLQGREKSLAAAFRASLGEDNKFEEFLTKVFQKKIKRGKPKENVEGEDDTYEHSGEEDDWDEDDEDEDYFSNTDERGSSLDDSVCPPGCDPQLFDNTLKLRNHRLDLEEQLAEEKKNVDALVKECDTLTKKKKSVEVGRKAAEDDLEKVNQEKHLRSNDLDVVVPLRLRQIEFVVDGSVPVDLSPALVLPRTELKCLQERITQLHSEKIQQREIHSQAHQQHIRLIHECKDMDAEIQVLEKQCNQLMMMKFGRQVDLEALQTLSGNRTLEELKQEKLLQESQYDKDIKDWEGKVEEARQSLADVTMYNTERLRCLKSLVDKKNGLEQKLQVRQRNII